MAAAKVMKKETEKNMSLRFRGSIQSYSLLGKPTLFIDRCLSQYSTCSVKAFCKGLFPLLKEVDPNLQDLLLVLDRICFWYKNSSGTSEKGSSSFQENARDCEVGSFGMMLDGL